MCFLIFSNFNLGNILLTDHEHTIISVLRPRTDEDQDVKFTVKEKYPIHLAKVFYTVFNYLSYQIY